VNRVLVKRRRAWAPVFGAGAGRGREHRPGADAARDRRAVRARAGRLGLRGQRRGANAVDWQQVRAGASGVASGPARWWRAARQHRLGAGARRCGAAAGNAASGLIAPCAGGQANQATGVLSWVPGGLGAATRGCYGKGAWSSGSLGTHGRRAGRASRVLRPADSDARRRAPHADGAAPGAGNTANLPNNGTFLVRLMVAAQASGRHRRRGGRQRRLDASRRWSAAAPGGQHGPLARRRDAAAAGWRLSVTADTANGGPRRGRHRRRRTRPSTGWPASSRSRPWADRPREPSPPTRSEPMPT
jgi:hypothetical protein